MFALAALAASTSPSARAQQRPLPYVPGEVLVTYRPGAQAATMSQATRELGARVVRKLAPARAHLLRLSPGASTEAAIRRLRQDPTVASVQPNFIYHASLSPNEPAFSNGYLWGMHNTGQNAGTADADMDAPDAWGLTTGAANVAVAVIDTGVDYTHPDLASNIWTNPGETGAVIDVGGNPVLDASGQPVRKETNGADDDGNGYVDDVHGWNGSADNGNPMDDNEHGTHVAGTIGALGNNGLGVVGVNWNVQIVACKFLAADGSGTTADAIECLDYVTRLKQNGLNVVATNNSWGGGPYDPALRDAITRSEQAGILFVAAAGNGDAYGRAINSDASLQYPASYPNVGILSVTATDRNNQKASWANYGATTIDLGAPGVSIWSTVPGAQYAALDGTSMAAPHVTGAVALLKAYSPGLSLQEVKDRLLNTGDPVPALEGMTFTGRRLNLYNALTGYSPAKPPKVALGVTVTTNKTTAYRMGETVTMTTRVTGGTSVVAGASVSLSLVTASGRRYAASSTTGSGGTMVLSFRPSSGDGRGTYRVTSTASRSGYESGTGTRTFTVQ